MVPELRPAIDAMIERLRDLHSRQLIEGWWTEDGGLGRGEIVRPLHRVGCYVPGGRASYLSTVAMTVVPARAAGVDDIVVCSPLRGDGSLPAEVLYAEGPQDPRGVGEPVSPGRDHLAQARGPGGGRRVVTVRLPTVLRDLAGGVATLEAEGRSVREVLEGAAHPGFAARISTATESSVGSSTCSWTTRTSASPRASKPA